MENNDTYGLCETSLTKQIMDLEVPHWDPIAVAFRPNPLTTAHSIVNITVLEESALDSIHLSLCIWNTCSPYADLEEIMSRSYTDDFIKNHNVVSINTFLFGYVTKIDGMSLHDFKYYDNNLVDDSDFKPFSILGNNGKFHEVSAFFIKGMYYNPRIQLLFPTALQDEKELTLFMTKKEIDHYFKQFQRV